METTKESIERIELIINNLVEEDRMTSDEYHYVLNAVEYLKDKFLNGDTEKRTNKQFCPNCKLPLRMDGNGTLEQLCECNT